MDDEATASRGANPAMGEPLRRLEDARFLKGLGRYVDDIHVPNEAFGVSVLSAHAHARLVSIDITNASRAPGVVAVLTGEMAQAAGLGGLPAFNYPEDWGGPISFKTIMPILAIEHVRYVGERVAFVVAETLAAAIAASELVHVDYEPLAAVTSLASARSGQAVWAECRDNVAFKLSIGEKAKVDAAFIKAAHVVQVNVAHQRLAAAPLEPRAAIGCFDAADERFTLWTTSQNPHGVRHMLAGSVLRVPEARIRVISPDVGGGFGTKANAYPEDALVLWAAEVCRRPVRWTSTRAESMATDNHGRDHWAKAEMAVDADGRVLALRVDSLHALGAYFVSASASPARSLLRLVPGVYRIPLVFGEARALFTHTAPVGVYRGAGRPEANMLIERLMDRAAQVCDLSPDEIRRRNILREQDMPYATGTGSTYDTGDFAGLLETCLDKADWRGFDARKRAAGERGVLLGRSVCPYVEYGGVGNERMELRVDAQARALILSGTHAHGQGHATSYAQIVAERLGLPVGDIRFMQGDTDLVAFGRGTYAARSSLVGGCALALAADAVVEKAKRLAATLLQCKAEDVILEGGMFRDAGGASLPWAVVAKAAYGFMLPPGVELGLEGIGVWAALPPNYPNGCHACEIEIDPETGASHITRYTIVDDVGTIINPMICEGQIHGGFAQGVGQALMEEVVYSTDGQLVSGSFMDYAMPRADDVPPIDITFDCIASSTNILGVKSVGESSIVASPSAICLALLDALRPFGVEDLTLPATPARIFKAIAEARCRGGVEA